MVTQNNLYLTPREREVVKLIGSGLINKQVAAIMSISEQTVKNHLSAIMQKLNFNNRYQLVRFYVACQVNVCAN